jgi:hypothetical protein
MRNQIDNVPAAKASDFRRRLRPEDLHRPASLAEAETKISIACNRPRKSAAGFCRRKSEPRPLKKTDWQELTRYRKTDYLKVVSVCDLKWFRRIYDGKIRRPVDLLVATLRIATNPSSCRLIKHRSSLLCAMCDRNRKILCLVATTREIRTGAAVSVLVIVPWKGCSDILRGSSWTKAAARLSAQLPKGLSI